jgi:GNAT superfamily N-acetyltransferase
LTQVDLSKPRVLHDFVALEHRLVKQHHRLFVSEPDAVVKHRLSGASAFFNDAELAGFVAGRPGAEVGRCAAIINRRWQRSKREKGVIEDAAKVGFIGYFAAAPKVTAAVKAMLEEAETWLESRGMKRVIAPCNGNALLGAGLLTDAFTESPMFPMPWNPRYYVDYFEMAGYAPSYPIWVYEVDFGSPGYQLLQAKQERIRPNALPEWSIRRINKQDWQAEIDRLLELFNAGFTGEWELQEFTSDEFHQFWDPLEDVLPSEFIQFVDIRDQRSGTWTPVGFCVGFPDWTPLLRSNPAGLNTTNADDYVRAGLIGGALTDPDLRGTGLGTTVVAHVFRQFEEELHLPGALYYFINHVNTASRGLGEAAGGQGRILYHCYDKVIA